MAMTMKKEDQRVEIPHARIFGEEGARLYRTKDQALRIDNNQTGFRAGVREPEFPVHVTLVLLIGAVLLAGLPGCLRVGLFDDDADTKASKSAAETSIYREVSEMVKLYRICLQKNEETPAKAKENCGMYKDAIRDLAPDNMRTIVAEVLDRLRDKSPKPSARREIEP